MACMPNKCIWGSQGIQQCRSCHDSGSAQSRNKGECCALPHLSCMRRWQQRKRWSATTRWTMPGCSCRKRSASLLPLLLGPSFLLGDTGLQWRPTRPTNSRILRTSSLFGCCSCVSLLATLRAVAQAPDESHNARDLRRADDAASARVWSLCHMEVTMYVISASS